MKVLIVGNWTYLMYERAFADGLKTQGVEVFEYSWRKYFKSFLGRFELKFGVAGLMTRLFNKDLLKYVEAVKPDTVLLWRGTNILPSTLHKLRKLGVGDIASYNHDDFSGPEAGAPIPHHHKYLWRLFLKCAPLVDHHFVKRQSNVKHLLRLGARSAHIMPMWFDPKIHRPVELVDDELEIFTADVVFVGHFEPDGREKSIRALVEANIHTKLWGGHYWTPAVLGDTYSKLAPITLAEGDSYAKALCGAKVCLCFLSKLNRDTYTRRCFEIPACGRVLLAERTDDLMRMFDEDKEACFFSSTEELVKKVQWLLDNPLIRNSIAEAGLRRVWQDGHDVKSRAKEFLNVINTSNPG